MTTIDDKPSQIATSTTQSSTERQTLIDTAVKFLQNPKVIPTAIENKRLFLAKKGLTESEVEFALRSAGCYDVNTANTVQNQNQALEVIPQQQQQQQQQQLGNIQPIIIQQPPSLFFRIAKWVANLLVAGCIAFTAYKLIVKKLFAKKKSKVEKDLETMISNNKKLQDSINDMRNSLTTLKETIDNMTGAIKQISTEKPTVTEESIKSEVQSIKSLLLNRTQFPGIPTVTPVLPTWQLENKSTAGSNSQTNIKSLNEDNKEKNETCQTSQQSNTTATATTTNSIKNDSNFNGDNSNDN